MEKGTELLHGHFHYKPLPYGGVDGTKVVCIHCKGVFSYHRSTSSLKYHLNAIHSVDYSKSPTITNSGESLLLTACGRSTTLDKQKQDELTNAITKWIATNCRPISIVEDVGLRNMLRIATSDDKYKPPSRRTVTRRIHELYEVERTIKAMALQRAPAVALTGDYWTSLGNHNHLGVTVHYIDEQWELQSHALTVMKTEDGHFAETCAEHFIHVAQQWNVSDKVSTLSTDSARNMIAGARHLPFEHVPCVAHSLQRSVTVSLLNSAFDDVLAKCREVVGHFKRSPASAAELEHQQIEHGQKKESLVQDIPTRWNSTLDMIKSVRRNEQPLRDVLTTQDTEIAMPTTAEMDNLQRLETLLEHCRDVTELLGGEKYVSCSVVLPAFCHLSRVMESSDDDPAYVVKFKSTFRTDLKTREENANIAYLKIATALDPRFKDLKCVPRAERAEVWASVTNLVKEQRVVAEQPVEATTSEPPKKKIALLAASSESDSEQEEDSVENGVRRYRAEPTISTEACPLEWWSKHAGSHCRLASIAQKYLATPATSVPCERLFSLAGHIVQKKRVSLSSENVNDLVCLSSWLGAEE
ncbi:zinc finger BED domain-containing protein 1-like [Anarrhichthys ocellatus]|uniref:zinc finger BED domain-containing protein 1-like n=1 Tax=Anarrhichthys ocellatus TaxID=433405 RepID=UPI0012EDE16A|nr:zinc finger BED domain-containing protein 1-like [Anarrhichthys ocellatus]